MSRNPTALPSPTLRPLRVAAMSMLLTVLACGPTRTSPPASDTATSADARQDTERADTSTPDTAAPDTRADASAPDTTRVDTQAPDTSAADTHAETDASLPGDQAAALSHTLPSSLLCGESATATVTMRNHGTTTWTAADDYKLGAFGDSDPFYGPDPRVYLAAADSVAPGQNHVFTVALTAPVAPGTYTTDWQMVRDGVGWFGDVVTQDVQVVCSVSSSLDRKLMMGYQGWFACPDDGSQPNRWVHWFRDNVPDAAHATFDLWPDTSEQDPSEGCPTAMTMPDGSTAMLFSSANAATVDRHFAWMETYGVDGVFLQRFSSELGDPAFLSLRDQVTLNVKAAAEAHGRLFVIMYDVSGDDPSSMAADVAADWRHLVDDLQLTASPSYVQHGGLPLVAIWGLGFTDRAPDVAQATATLDAFRNAAEARHRTTLMGGVPTYWRTLDNDSKSDPGWASVYRSFDIISPWTVGRFGDDGGADAFRRDLLEPDLREAAASGLGYMPVLFPGFSWVNLTGGQYNAIPRRGGAFYWRQAYNAVSVGSTMLYVAMFDEVDEGTAMFKVAPSAAQRPTQGTFLTLDAEGQSLPADWYLRLAGESARMLRGELAPTTTMPISP